MKLRVALVLAAALASACTPRVSVVERPAPAGLPEAEYRQAAAQGKAVYRVDAAQSLVAITVRRGGPLARLGHDHVVASHDVDGFVLPAEGRADLILPLERLVVDEAALRAEAGLDTQPSESDIAGTRQNMLEKVLEAERYPYVALRIRGFDAAAGRIAASLTLHGVTRELAIPAQVESGAREVAATGRFEIDQSDYGITPFSVLGGAIRVQDRLELRFRVRARRLD